MGHKPLFLIFVNTNISTKLIQQILNGTIHAYIYCPPNIGLLMRQAFAKNSSNSFFKIIPLRTMFSYDFFNILFTSKSFWDNIPNNYGKIFVLYNPRNLALTINYSNIIKKKIPFGMLPMKELNFTKAIKENPSLIDEELSQGFLFYIKAKYAKKVLEKFKKSHILSVRKQLKLNNNEHIERLSITPFYLYFYHFMQTTGYELPVPFTISNPNN